MLPLTRFREHTGRSTLGGLSMRPIARGTVAFAAVVVAAVCLYSYARRPSNLVRMAASRISVESGGIETEARWLADQLSGSVPDRIDSLVACYRVENDQQCKSLIVRALGSVDVQADERQAATIAECLMTMYHAEGDEVVRGQIILSLLQMNPRQDVSRFAESVCLDESEGKFVRQDALRIVRRSMSRSQLEAFLERLEASPNEAFSKRARELRGSISSGTSGGDPSPTVPKSTEKGNIPKDGPGK